MTLLRWFPLVLCGCLVVPATRTTTRSLGTRDGDVYEDGDRGLELAGSASGAEVVVRATRIRDCHRDVLAVTEVTRDRHLELGGSKDPRARVFGVVLAPVLIPVSGIVSGISVLLDGGGTTETTRVDHVDRLRCTRPAEGLPIELVAPSGRILRGTIDGGGAAVVQLPESEPYRGLVVARAEGVSTNVAFARPKPAVTAVRDAAYECASRTQRVGAVRIVVSVDPKGAPVSLHVSAPGADTIAGDDDLATCIGSAIAGVKFPSQQRGRTVVLPLELSPRS